jgi:predicted PurR-regulated permease PerM
MAADAEGHTPASARPSAGAALRLSALRSEHLYKAVALAFLLALLYRFFSEIAQTLLLLYAAAILAVLFNALVTRIPLQRRWVSVLLGILVLGALAGLTWLGIPALLGELHNIVDQAPAFEATLRNVEQWIRTNTGLNIDLVGPQAEAWIQNLFSGVGSGDIVGGATSVLGALLVPLIILFGALFAVGNPNDRLLTPLLRVVPRRQREAWRRIFELLGIRLLGWGRGVLIGMIAVGLLSYLAFMLIGVPNALLLAVISGLTEAVPLLGPWVGGAIATTAAFLSDPGKALWTALAALAIQQFENNLIVPWAMSKAADVHPFVTLFALVLFGNLFGFLGILLSIPLFLLAWTLVEVLWVEHAIDTDEDRIEPVVEE